MKVEDAIQLATDYVKKFFGGTDHRLEEIESKDDGGFEVTISFLESNAVRVPGANEPFLPLGGRRAAIGIDPHRMYKVVLIKDGQVKSAHVRQFVVG